MEKLFTSFREIANTTLRLEKVLESYEHFHAHTHSQKEPEKLHEHTVKVLDYFFELADIHGIDQVADSLITEITNNGSSIEDKEEFGNYLKRLFIDSISFHDYGKINENFQVEKMNNNYFQPNPDNQINSQHSKLSAYLFLNYHFKEIFELETERLNEHEKALLYAFTYLFANPILRHHSSFIDHYIDFEQEVLTGLKSYLDSLCINISEELREGFFKGYDQIFEVFNDEFRGTDCFPVYALLKLNFSLLTSADFYATFAFRNNLEIDDFGLLSPELKQNYALNFKALKDYNQKLFDNFDDYLQLPFEKLQERNHENLNQLRQKLSAEVISNIRKYSSHRLFYLEGPTGSGKTNLSLAASIELLQLYKNLNKVFYVFPFTTLVSQTFKTIKETIGVTNEQLIQLHSKSGFHSKREEKEDGIYGDQQLNYIDNLFLNYPITLLTHIKFFDILKGNGKESNYLLHRLSNSIVIIDELQTYNPKHWDKVIFFLSNYARHFNIYFILMSATLPKIDELDEKTRGEIVSLVSNKKQYFQNPNFGKRVVFDFSLLEKDWQKAEYLELLSDFIFEQSEKLADDQEGKIRVLVECITKKTASRLYKIVNENKGYSSYKKYLISGEILEPRRKEIIESIEQEKDEKVIAISTQVVEAGVDIDMDLGFKDRSLIDSDEQLAGRINRNAAKNNCKVYLFDYDPPHIVYKNDKRYEVMKKEITEQEYQEILSTKDFDRLYERVNQSIIKRNEDEFIENFEDYKRNFRRLNFSKIKNEFKLIEESSNSVYIPLDVPIDHFEEEEKKFLLDFNVNSSSDSVNGGEVFEVYRKILTNGDTDFIFKNIDLKKIYGIMSKFMFSVFRTQESVFKPYIDPEISEKFGILYLKHWHDIYSYDGGIDTKKVDGAVFI